MRRWLLTIGFVLTLAPAAEAGQLLVVSSTDPVIPPGAVIDGDKAINVADGAELRMLAEDGTPVAIQGPFSGLIPLPVHDEAVPAPEGPPLVEALAEMVGEGKIDSSEFGATRSVRPNMTVSDAWMVDLSSPGIVCVQPGGRPQIWHSVAGGGLFRALDGKGEAKLAFAGDGKAQAWPEGLPISDGGGYAFVSKTGSPILMTLKRAPAGLPTLAHVIRWLSDNGCARQARLILHTMPMPDPVKKLSLSLGTLGDTLPSYKVGETLTIELGLSENAYVRCFYGQAKGATVQLFPNRFNPSQRLAGPFVHTIPDSNDPFSIKLSGPASKETVRCFGWRNDPSATLPADVKGADVTAPLKRPFEAVAAEIMASANPPSTEASLEIKVTN